MLIGGAIARRLNDLVPNVAVADFRRELKVVVQRAANKKKKWLSFHTEGLPNVLTTRGPGAPMKSQFIRQRESEKFLVDVESAYRRPRLKDGKPPTKTDVARELGIAGDPKRGGQSSL